MKSQSSKRTKPARKNKTRKNTNNNKNVTIKINGHIIKPKSINGWISLKIYGKPDDVEKLIKNLVNNAVDDCKNDLSPVIKDIVNDTEYTNAAQRQVKNKLEDILKNREGEINNFVIGSINEPLFEKIENKINNNAEANKLLKRVLSLFFSKNLVIIQPRNAKQMK